MQRHFQKILLIIAIVGPSSFFRTLAQSEETLVVTTAQGSFRGAKTGNGFSFKNIPFAAPPVGSLRWRGPHEPAAFGGTRDATEFGPICLQLRKGQSIGQEDCLQLNVWTPADPRSQAIIPVVVWIHGGAHMVGSAVQTGEAYLPPPHGLSLAGVQVFDGQRLAEQTGAIVVTINYRLGTLGFLAHQALQAEDTEHGSFGNYGRLDQIAALKWVQQNIASFGGDRNRVTIAGQSAGAVGVCVLVTSPLTKGLFSGAIMQSGRCNAFPKEKAMAIGKEIVKSLRCESSATDRDTANKEVTNCLRSLTPEEVLLRYPTEPDTAKVSNNKFSSAVDGWVLTDIPEKILAQGDKYTHIPMIIGSTTEENGRAIPHDLSPEDYVVSMKQLIPQKPGDKPEEWREKVLAQYSLDKFESPYHANVALTSDFKFVCFANRAVKRSRRSQEEPIFQYVFGHALTNAPLIERFGAWHGEDVLFLFGLLGRGIGPLVYQPTVVETALSNSMMRYWGQFFATGNPNLVGEIPWPASDNTDPYLLLNATSSVQHGVRIQECVFWDNLGWP